MPTKHPEILLVNPDTENIACDGGGALGHPKVYYSFDDNYEVICGYCDRLFTKVEQKGAKKYSS